MANKDIEKIIKKVQLDSDKKIERCLGILQEQTIDKFKIVKEGMDSINQRLDGIDRRLDGVDLRFDGIDLRLDGIDQRLYKVDQRLNIMQSDIVIIKNNLKQKVDHREFESLVGRVSVVEKLS